MIGAPRRGVKGRTAHPGDRPDPRRLSSPAVGGPDVSAVIVGHSVRAELERCLDELDRHAGVALQTIVVDNASTDGTGRWLREHRPDVELIELPRNEFGAARNHALPLVRGRYTLFLDSDAYVTPGAVPALVRALDEHPSWGLVGPRLVYEDGSLQLSARRFPPPHLPFLRRPPLDRLFEDGATVRRHLMADEDHDRTRPVVYMISACHLFRSELARRLGPLDPALAWGGEDVDWCLRVRDAGYEVVYVPEATVVHTYRRLSRAAPISRSALRHLRSFAHLQRKYARRWPELRRLARELDRRTA